jgi:hypothetical protein
LLFSKLASWTGPSSGRVSVPGSVFPRVAFSLSRPWETLGVPPLRSLEGPTVHVALRVSAGRLRQAVPPAGPCSAGPNLSADVARIAIGTQVGALHLPLGGGDAGPDRATCPPATLCPQPPSPIGADVLRTAESRRGVGGGRRPGEFSLRMQSLLVPGALNCRFLRYSLCPCRQVRARRRECDGADLISGATEDAQADTHN